MVGYNSDDIDHLEAVFKADQRAVAAQHKTIICGIRQLGEKLKAAEERIAELEEAIIKTLNDNAHLADGDNCTLADLKKVINE